MFYAGSREPAFLNICWIILLNTIGITATDQRPDRKKLETVFGTYSTSLSLREAMENEVVTKANVFRIETNIDLSQIKFNGKDYVNADLEKKIILHAQRNL